MARLIALDIGLKRTGIAITDELQIIASGLTTVETHELLTFLKDYFNKNEVEKIIIGKPKQLNNQPSESFPIIEAQVKLINEAFEDKEICYVDERFTSKIAFNTMITSGIGKKKRQNKALIDEISATIILQSFMDSLR